MKQQVNNIITAIERTQTNRDGGVEPPIVDFKAFTLHRITIISGTITCSTA